MEEKLEVPSLFDVAGTRPKVSKGLGAVNPRYTGKSLLDLPEKEFRELVKGQEREALVYLGEHLAQLQRLPTSKLIANSQSYQRLMNAYKVIRECITKEQDDSDNLDYLSRLFGSVRGKLDIAIRGDFSPGEPRLPQQVN